MIIDFCSQRPTREWVSVGVGKGGEREEEEEEGDDFKASDIIYIRSGVAREKGFLFSSSFV